MSNLDAHRDAYERCLYCPSLCRHACPVATAEERDTVTPWGLMSLAHHVATGRAEPTAEIAELLHHCSGCRACTVACLYDNDVENAIVAARGHMVEHGVSPLDEEQVRHDRAIPRRFWDDHPALSQRHLHEPTVLMLPGHRDLSVDAGPMQALAGLCEKLGEEELACGDASGLDVGHDLWRAGFDQGFRSRAAAVQEELVGARHVVVLSPEALYVLRHVYPAHGVRLEADLQHVTEFLLPFMAGARVTPVRGRVAYHDACHLARHLDLVDVPRELLGRVLAEPLVELPRQGRRTACCGGTGCMPMTTPDATRAMAEEVVAEAREAGAERLVTFAPECVASLRRAAGDTLRVDHGLAVLHEAVAAGG